MPTFVNGRILATAATGFVTWLIVAPGVSRYLGRRVRWRHRPPLPAGPFRKRRRERRARSMLPCSNAAIRCPPAACH